MVFNVTLNCNTFSYNPLLHQSYDCLLLKAPQTDLMTFKQTFYSWNHIPCAYIWSIHPQFNQSNKICVYSFSEVSGAWLYSSRI